MNRNFAYSRLLPIVYLLSILAESIGYHQEIIN